MDRCHLRPSPPDLLQGDCHLPEMIGYIRQLLGGEDPISVASNAALAYLALVVAFSDRGLLRLNWAPRILIEVGKKEFEVSPVVPVQIPDYASDVETDYLGRPTAGRGRSHGPNRFRCCSI